MLIYFEWAHAPPLDAIRGISEDAKVPIICIMAGWGKGRRRMIHISGFRSVMEQCMKHPIPKHVPRWHVYWFTIGQLMLCGWKSRLPWSVRSIETCSLSNHRPGQWHVGNDNFPARTMSPVWCINLFWSEEPSESVSSSWWPISRWDWVHSGELLFSPATSSGNNARGDTCSHSLESPRISDTSLRVSW